MAQTRRATKGKQRSKSPRAPQSTQQGRREEQAPEPKEKERRIDGNQGEGNREADRRYREGVANFERSGRVPKAADEARRAVDAEEQGGRRPRDEDDEEVDSYEDVDVDDRDEIRVPGDRSRLS
jgi:hypothetical protein